MKVGDLVERKIKGPIDSHLVAKTGKYGLVISKLIAGNPSHKCAIVYWANSRTCYSIAEYLIEVVSESR